MITSPWDASDLRSDHPLDDVRAFLARFVAFPSDWSLNAVTLWAAHAHALDAFDSTPRLALLSPEPGSGKSRTLEVLELLVPRPMFTMNCSAAAMFRKIADPEGRPTILLDEADTVFGPRSAKEHEDLRGMVNAGHRRGATATRAAPRGREIVVEDFETYAAVALAGLDDLPDTIMTRAVVVRMRRRAPDETVEPFRHRLHAPEGRALCERLGAWMEGITPALSDSWPEMPEGVEDRAADVWEPLVAIADAAGGQWSEVVRRDAVTAVTANRGNGETLGIRLLSDVRDAFVDLGTDHAFTTTLLDHLTALDESPWGDLRGKPLDARGLARRLSKYGVKPATVRVGSETAKGYARDELVDVFRRYLPACDGVTDVTDTSGHRGKAEPSNVTDLNDVTEGYPLPNQETRTQTAEEPLVSLFAESSVTSVTPSQCTRCRGRLDEATRLIGADRCSDCERAEVAS